MGTQWSLLTGCPGGPGHSVGSSSHKIPRLCLEIGAGQGHFLLVEAVRTPCVQSLPGGLRPTNWSWASKINHCKYCHIRLTDSLCLPVSLSIVIECKHFAARTLFSLIMQHTRILVRGCIPFCYPNNSKNISD